jgi:hypothetical protein
MTNLHRYGDPLIGEWSGLAPDGSALFVRDLSTQEVYALDLELPQSRKYCSDPEKDADPDIPVLKPAHVEDAQLRYLPMNRRPLVLSVGRSVN